MSDRFSDPELIESMAAYALASERAEDPPPGLRQRVLGALESKPQPPMSGPAEAFGRAVADLASLLERLDPEDWERPAEPYRWTVHGLVAHLLVIERYTTAVLGLDDRAGDGPDLAAVLAELGGDPGDHLGLGHETIARELEQPPVETANRWRGAAERLVVAATGLDQHGLDQSVTVHHWPMSVGTALVARTFEVWTHADDIRRATGRPQRDPSTSDLAVMSATSVGSLGPAVAAVTDRVPTGLARVVLTGPGGRTFLLPLGQEPEPPAGRVAPDRPTLVTVVADVVDYCRMAARRIEPAELSVDIEGDAELGRSLLEAAQLLAV